MTEAFGTIIYWNSQRKWGFIDVDDSDQNILFNDSVDYERGQRIRFNLLPVGSKGPTAVDITVIDE